LITDSGTIGWIENQYDDRLIHKAFDRIIIDEPNNEEIGQRRYHDTRYSTFTDAYKNTNLANIYDLSPFDETVMLDVDYLMLDDTMDLVWNNIEDFMCNYKTSDLNHTINNFGFNNRFNYMSIPLYWATAVYFRKTEKSRLIFQMMNYVKENYAYYQYLYQFTPSGYFRNDYALSIAIHLLNNLMEYGSIKSLPVDSLLFSLEEDEMHAFKDGRCIISSEPEQGDFRLHDISRNVHVMNKRAILRKASEIITYAIG
jgi:hypothetical protein